MSHFVVLVIGAEVEKQLAPYHEFECTGRADEFVVDVDITAEARETFAKSTKRRLRDPDGKLHEPCDDRFYRDPTPEENEKAGPMLGTGCGGGVLFHSKDWGDGRGYRAKVRFVPDGWTEVDAPACDVESFAEWVDGHYGAHPVPHGEEPDKTGPHKYGYALLDAAGGVVKVVDRTNPNARWDWFVVGGRWTGFFKMKPETESKGPSATGRPGLMTEAARPGYADEALLCDVDIGGMRAEAEVKAAGEFDHYATAFSGKPIPSWEEIRERHAGDIEAARKEHGEEPVVKALRALDKNHDLLWAGDYREHFCGGDRAAFLKRARDSAMVTFAIVKDGRWFERGSMGWWGCVSCEMDRGEWNDRFARLLDDLPPETPLTVVDCHI